MITSVTFLKRADSLLCVIYTNVSLRLLKKRFCFFKGRKLILDGFKDVSNLKLNSVKFCNYKQAWGICSLENWIILLSSPRYCLCEASLVRTNTSFLVFLLGLWIWSIQYMTTIIMSFEYVYKHQRQAWLKEYSEIMPWKVCLPVCIY